MEYLGHAYISIHVGNYIILTAILALILALILAWSGQKRKRPVRDSEQTYHQKQEHRGNLVRKL